MNSDLFRGKLVRLSAEEPEEFGKAFSRWMRDSEYIRLLDTQTAVLLSEKKVTEWFKLEELKMMDDILFSVRNLTEDRLVGFIALWGIRWNHGNSWMAIGIGDRQDWGRGYGRDALQVLLRYAFTELNLHRVGLYVFDYNLRARHVYEKCGFIYEGALRRFIYRDGNYWDEHVMGILKSEWEALAQDG